MNKKDEEYVEQRAFYIALCVGVFAIIFSILIIGLLSGEPVSFPVALQEYEPICIEEKPYWDFCIGEEKGCILNSKSAVDAVSIKIKDANIIFDVSEQYLIDNNIEPTGYECVVWGLEKVN